MENEIGGETEMEERTGGQRKGRRMGKAKKTPKNCKVKQNRVSVCLHTLRLFTPVFKVHARTIREVGTIKVIPPLSADLNPKACLVIKGT